MKKFLIGFAVFFLLLLVAVFTLPIIFKDKIVAQVKEAANESLTATVDFKDVDISILRHFPKVSVGLQDIDVTGTGPFEGVKLVQAKNLDVAVDLWSAVFGDKVAIKGVYLQDPDLRVYVLEDGRANYDIVKPNAEEKAEADPSSGTIELEHYEIRNGKLLYDDRGLDMRMELEGLNHEGSGEFTAAVYDLIMKTAVEKLSVDYGGIQYLNDARADWTTTLNANTRDMKFTLKDNKLKVNDLDLDLNGWVQLPNDDDVVMDLTFGTPANTFKSLLSLVPGAYVQNFQDVKANGTVQFAGFVKGKYNEKTYPAFKVDFKIGNGDFKYPSLPLGVTNINVDASVNSPSSRLNDMTVRIPKFSLKIGSNPLEGYFNLKTPESDPTVDMRVAGTINLGELSKAFPVEGVQELNGIIRANMVAKAAMSQIERQQYDQVDMSGGVVIQNMVVRSEGQPAVNIVNLATTLTPQRLEIQTLDARLGKSDLRGSGAIDNVLAYFSTNKTMRGNLTLSSNFFDADEWMTEEAPAADASKVPSSTAPAAAKPFDAWDFTVDGKVNRLHYDEYDLTNVALQGHFLPNKMDIDRFALQIGGSDLSGSGQILNVWNYLFDDQTLSGTVNLKSKFFDLNQFMTDDAAPAQAGATPPAEEVVVIPQNIAMVVNADLDEVRYTNYTLNNVNGQIQVKDGVASLKDCTAGVLGGQVGLTGAYDTKNPAKPAFNMDMALQNMGFRDAFQNFVTVKTLAPVAQLMDGKFNTTLSMSGLLGKGMVPDFNSLSAAGFIETINAVLVNAQALTQISSRLNVDYLKRLEIGNTKNWFEIKNGQVVVKPFNLQVRDIAMQIGGSHGINQEMNYQIATKVPRKLLDKVGVGAAVNTGLNFLSKEAAKYNVNLAQGEFINVRFDLTGSLFSPKVGVKVLGTDGKATVQETATAAVQATVDKIRDSLNTVANQQIEKAKAEGKAMAQKAVDSLKREADKKVQEAAAKASEQLKQEAGKKVGETIGKEGDKTIKQVEEKLDKWNPFGNKDKKKKDNR